MADCSWVVVTGAQSHRLIIGSFICPKLAHNYPLLRVRRERPRGRRTAEQRDELAAFHLIEVHSVPVSQGRIAG
jgi:hypothetical protein